MMLVHAVVDSFLDFVSDSDMEGEVYNLANELELDDNNFNYYDNEVQTLIDNIRVGQLNGENI